MADGNEKGLPAVRGMYRTIEEVQKAFVAASKSGNLLAPMARVDYVPDLHSLSLRIVNLELSEHGGDLYQDSDSRGKDEWSLSGRALDKIAAAAGISWDVVLSGRLDDRSDPLYCHYRAVGWVVDFDGTRRQISGEKEIDFRDGSPQIAKMKPGAVSRASAFILPLAESKAKNRAIRHALSVKSKYSMEELRRPFVVPKLVFTGEGCTDPEIKRMIAERIVDRAMGVQQQIYGPSHSNGYNIPSLQAVPQDHGMGRVPPPPIRQRIGQAPAPIDIDDDPFPEAPTRDAAAGAPQAREDCGCPDAPNDVHLEGCKQAGKNVSTEAPY